MGFRVCRSNLVEDYFPQARPMKADVKDKSFPPRDGELFLGRDIQPLFVTAALSILQHYPE